MAKRFPDCTGKMFSNLFYQSGMYLKKARGNTLGSLFQLIVDDARTEKKLEELGLEPKRWIDEESRVLVRQRHAQNPNLYPSESEYIFIGPTRLEKYLRRLHIQSVEHVLFDRVFQSKTGDVTLLLNEDKTIYAELGTNPNRKWWDEAINDQLKMSKPFYTTDDDGILPSILPRETKGADRALRFFKYLDLK
jgi:hypothetical protein